jgi:hypothetical protein
MEYNYKNLFASQKEKFIAILGKDYYSSLLVEEDLSDSAVIISDRRVYQIGRLYEFGFRGHNGSLRRSSGKKTVNLEDVTAATSREVIKPAAGSSVIALGVLAVILGLLSDVLQSTIIMRVIGAVILAAGIFLILHSRRRYLIVEYRGGNMVLPVKFVSHSELDLFQGIVMTQKDRAKDGSSDFKICPNCAEKVDAQAKVCSNCGQELKVDALD